MRGADLVGFSWAAVTAQRQRSLLTILGIAVGIATVILLTAMGEGLRQFALGEFTQFGTNLIAIHPGKTTTLGGSIGQISTNRPLTIDDARVLQRLPDLQGVVPVIQGNAQVEAGARRRRTMVFGVSADMPQTYRMEVAFGSFLPAQDYATAQPLAVLGHRTWRELFGNENPLGHKVRIGVDSFRIIGVMKSKGQFLGFDLDDSLYVPVGRASAIFDREGLHEIDVLYREGLEAGLVKRHLRRTLRALHGQEDFSLTSQDQMLDVLGSILGVLTAGVAALGGISLLVGAIGIATIMTIALAERTAEIGLLRALGARRRDILRCFLLEAAVLGGVGGAAGLVLALTVIVSLILLAPKLPLAVAWPYAGAAVGLSVLIGLLAGLLPAARAAGLDPITALRAE
jgi:putative ABC transport system permease protein